MKELVGAFAAVTLLAGNAAAQDRIELEPASGWVMNYDDDSCALQRQFGPEGRQAFLEMRRFGLGEELQVTIASKDFALGSGDFSIRVEPIDSVPRSIEGRFNIALGDGYKGRLFSLFLAAGEAEFNELYSHFVDTTPILLDEQRALVHEGKSLSDKIVSAQGRDQRTFRDYQRLAVRDDYRVASQTAAWAFRQSSSYQAYFARLAAEVTGIGFSGAFDQPVYLRTGSLQEPMEAMSRCLDELQAHWGIDVEAHRTLTRPVGSKDYDKLVREMVKDYPSEMGRRGMPALLRVRVDVSAEGMPTGCHMQSAINDESFERKACNNMMRFARFYPALDVQGSAIRSYYQVSVVYQPQ